MSVLVNPGWDRAAVAAPSGEALAFHRTLPGYAPTPLRELTNGVLLKDESDRLGLPAFKVLGASWAVERALAGQDGAEPVRTLVTASAGNHGRAVAHVAAQRGLTARIYLPARAHPARRDAIAAEGAEVVVVDGDYEEAVARAAEDGQGPGCFELADVGAGGAAAWVIDGYATLFAELAEQAAFDTILVPAGVGALAAAAARFGASAGVAVWAVEPERAACVTASLAAGEPVAIPAPGTVMAGLDCAEVSPAAWPSLRSGLRGTITVSDDEARAAMADLAAAGMAIGECGAAPLAALPAARAATDVGIVVLVATEGLTA